MDALNQSLNEVVSSGKESKFGTHLIYIIASLTIALSLAALVCFAVVTGCIFHHLNEQKKRQLMCQNLEGAYTAVNDPVYEDIVGVFHTKEFQTCCNEAYQKS